MCTKEEINIVWKFQIDFAPDFFNVSQFSTSYHKLLRLVGDIQVHILVSGCVHKLWTFDEMKSLESPFPASEQIAQ